MLEVVRHDGYFDDLDADAVVWPKSQSGAMDMEALQFRAQLVDAIFQGLPRFAMSVWMRRIVLFAALLRNITRAAEFICNSGDNLSDRGRGGCERFFDVVSISVFEGSGTGGVARAEAVKRHWLKCILHRCRCRTPVPLQRCLTMWRRMRMHAGSRRIVANEMASGLRALCAICCKMWHSARSI